MGSALNFLTLELGLADSGSAINFITLEWGLADSGSIWLASIHFRVALGNCLLFIWFVKFGVCVDLQ